MNYQRRTERTYAVTPLPVKGYGLMLEVLPYIFLPENFNYSSISDPAETAHLFSPIDQPVATSHLTFIRNPIIEKHYPREISDFRVTEETFLGAVNLLEKSIGHGSLTGVSSGDVFDEMLDLPPLIAHSVHLYQVDEFGVPYIDHLRTVAQNTEIGSSENLEVFSNDDIVAGIAAAWLHDSIKDSEEFFYRVITEDDLLNWGINERTTHIVKLLTRTKNLPSEIYSSRILTDSIARTVKIAEIAHQTNAARILGVEAKNRKKHNEDYLNFLLALGYHEQVDTWFQPLADSLGNLNHPFTSDISAEAFSVAISSEPLPARFRSDAKLQEFERVHHIAMNMQKAEIFTKQDADDHIIFGLFWQFYLMQFDSPFVYNRALIAEFYDRKKSVVGSETDVDFYPIQNMSIPEIIKRAKKAKANLEKYNNRHLMTTDFDDTNHEFGEPEWSHLWPDLDQLTRDEAAELLLVAFAEFESFSDSRIQIHDIKTFITNCLQRIYKSI